MNVLNKFEIEGKIKDVADMRIISQNMSQAAIEYAKVILVSGSNPVETDMTTVISDFDNRVLLSARKILKTDRQVIKIQEDSSENDRNGPKTDPD